MGASDAGRGRDAAGVGVVVVVAVVVVVVGVVAGAAVTAAVKDAVVVVVFALATEVTEMVVNGALQGIPVDKTMRKKAIEIRGNCR